MSRARASTKLERRLALLEAGGEPNGTETPCADCEVPRTALNTSVIWSDQAKTRLTFHYAVCDACRSVKVCKRLRDDPAAKLVQMGADAAARTKRFRYKGAPLAARECTNLITTLLVEQQGRCASCKHEVILAADAGIYMASLDKMGARYDDGNSQVLCFGCQRLFNDLGALDRAELTRAIVHANAAPRPRLVSSLPMDFESSVATKLKQMHRREVSTDRPSRGAIVQLTEHAACRRLRRSGLHCVRVAPYVGWGGRRLNYLLRKRLTACCSSLLPCEQVVTNVPLSATKGDLFMWSFDRVIAGTDYALDTIQPVLHRYNDAKYVWDDKTARGWLDVFVRANGGRPHVIDLDAIEGSADNPVAVE